MQNLFRATWFKILLLVFGLIMLGSGGYTLYNALSPTVPAGYKDALLAVGEESTNLGKLFSEDLQQSLTGLEAKESASQWTAAAKIVENALAVVDEISTGTATLKTNIANLKGLSAKIRKADVREKALHLADLLAQLVPHLEEIVSLERQILKPVKDYYEDLAAHRTATLPSNLTTITANLTTESTAISDLGEGIVTTTNELYELLGISPTK